MANYSHAATPGFEDECSTCQKQIKRVYYGPNNMFFTYYHLSEIDGVADLL